VDQVLAGPVLAANEISGGTAGALIVLFLCVAMAFVFYFMFGSLKRLRRNVDGGQFGAPRTGDDDAPGRVEAAVVPHQPDGPADADRNA